MVVNLSVKAAVIRGGAIPKTVGAQQSRGTTKSRTTWQERSAAIWGSQCHRATTHPTGISRSLAQDRSIHFHFRLNEQGKRTNGHVNRKRQPALHSFLCPNSSVIPLPFLCHSSVIARDLSLPRVKSRRPRCDRLRLLIAIFDMEQLSDSAIATEALSKSNHDRYEVKIRDDSGTR